MPYNTQCFFKLYFYRRNLKCENTNKMSKIK